MNESRKKITYQRVLAYLLQDRLISCYNDLKQKQYQNLDSITGRTAWCDFSGGDEWGEVSLVYQEDLPVRCLWNMLFSIDDIDATQKKYQIEIDPKSIPSSHETESPTIKIETQSAIEISLEKKLNKKYPYEKEGFPCKGTLILGISDPTFSGFTNNLEIRHGVLDLEALKTITKKLSLNSCFERVLLVNSLVPFDQNPENDTYPLL